MVWLKEGYENIQSSQNYALVVSQALILIIKNIDLSRVVN